MGLRNYLVSSFYLEMYFHTHCYVDCLAMGYIRNKNDRIQVCSKLSSVSKKINYLFIRQTLRGDICKNDCKSTSLVRTVNVRLDHTCNVC